MRVVLKWALRITVVLGLAAVVVGLWKHEEITRLMAVNSLFAEDRIVANFSNMDRAFLSVEIPRGDGPVSDLPRGSDAAMPAEVDTWIRERAVTSLLVVKSGQIVHEGYYLGTGPKDRRIGWSIAKSFVSGLFGIVLAEGHITSLDDPVTKYVPQLVGTAYAEATIRNVLQMESGVIFDEDYLDYFSDINRMGRVLALGGTMDGFAAGLTETGTVPGTDWQYVSIDTHVIGMIIRGATGCDIPSLLAEKIIAPLGLEAAPYYLTDSEGVAFVLGGLNMRSRDYARFGVMFEQYGRFGDTQIVPAGWAIDSTTASAKTGPDELGYGYQWWMPDASMRGIFMARGIYGQYIYIDRHRDVVIVTTAADRQFREPGVNTQNVDMFRKIVASVVR